MASSCKSQSLYILVLRPAELEAITTSQVTRVLFAGAPCRIRRHRTVGNTKAQSNHYKKRFKSSFVWKEDMQWFPPTIYPGHFL